MNNLKNKLNTSILVNTDVKSDVKESQPMLQNQTLKDNIKPQKNENNVVSSLNVNIISNLSVKITVELGNAKMTIQKLLSLSKDKIIILDKLAGELLSIFANGLLIAYGEIVVIKNKYGIRIVNILNVNNFDNKNVS